jgi:hypothetical protein
LTKGTADFKLRLTSFTAISNDCSIFKNDYLKFEEIKMSKKLILGLALAVVLVSGAFYGAQADCGCLPHISMPTSFFCGACGAADNHNRDLDRAEATCQGAYNYGPTTPWVMGSPGF